MGFSGPVENWFSLTPEDVLVVFPDLKEHTMAEQTEIQKFEERTIRTAWDEKTEEWYFSVVDVIAVLTDSANPTDYLKKMRKRDELLAEYLGTNCPQVEMVGTTGKRRKVLAATTEQILRIIQSIPSPKAEPFKLWLAQVGRVRIEETIDPEQAIDRALEARTGKSAITAQNAAQLNEVVPGMLEAVAEKKK